MTSVMLRDPKQRACLIKEQSDMEIALICADMELKAQRKLSLIFDEKSKILLARREFTFHSTKRSGVKLRLTSAWDSRFNKKHVTTVETENTSHCTY